VTVLLRYQRRVLEDATPLRICLLGQHEAGYPRNVSIRRLLSGLGCVVEEHVSEAPGWLRELDILGHVLRRAHHIDVLFVTEGGHRFVPLLAPFARWLGKPLVFDPFTSRYNTYVEDRRLVRRSSLRAAQLRLMDWLAMRTADLSLFDTAEHRRYFERHYGPCRRSAVLEIGVDEDVFAPLAAEPEGDVFHVLFYGTYIPLQGVEVVVEAAQLLRAERGIHFTLVGRGQTRAAIEARVRELALANVTMCEPVPAADLPGWMARSQVVLGIFGGTIKAGNVVPNKLVQAAACGRPTITLGSPAVQRYFTADQSTVFVPAAAPAELAAAIVRLRADAELRARIGRGARSVFERHFSRQALAIKLSAALRQVQPTALPARARSAARGC
jgi:glycosyltransferase involved in cell wall biosynthesis